MDTKLIGYIQAFVVHGTDFILCKPILGSRALANHGKVAVITHPLVDDVGDVMLKTLLASDHQCCHALMDWRSGKCG